MSATHDARQSVLHFAMDGDTSGFFPQLARWHDRSAYRMYFGTLRPMAPWLRRYMESLGVRCFSCESAGRLLYPLDTFKLWRFLQRNAIDIIHTHLFDPCIVGLTAAWLARTPLRVMTRHHSDYHTRIHKHWHTRLDQFTTWMSHKVLAISQHTADVMTRVEGASEHKISIVYNGIDFERLRLSPPDELSRLRRELSPNGEFLCLQAARMHPEKGYEALFAAMRVVADKARKPVRLLVAGTGPLLPHYQQMVRDLGLDASVQFLGFRHDLPDLMAVSDVFVLASVAEAFGLVLTEALYLGTPVLATRIGGIPEIVEDGVGGILVPPSQPQALAAAILRLVEDDGLRTSLRGAGREKVVRRFGFERMMREYEAIYASYRGGVSAFDRPVRAAQIRHEP